MIVPHAVPHAMRLLIILTVVLAQLCAQESVPSDWREKIDDALHEGRERVALGLLAKEIEKASAPAAALELFADVAENVGEYDRADVAGARWLSEHPDDARAKMNRARQLWRRGEHAAALELLAPLLEAGPEKDAVPRWNFPAVALAGDIHVDRGEREEAEKLFDNLVTEAQRIVIREPQDLFALTRAYLFFGGKGLKLAEKELIGLQKKGGPDVDVALGRLYLDRYYTWADAAAEFKESQKKRPAYVPALIGMAAACTRGMEKERAKTAVEQAAAVNPSDADLLALQATEDLDAFQVEKAAEKVARGLRSTPKHKQLLSLEIAGQLLSAHKAEADRLFEDLLKLDPTYGEGLRTIAGILNQRRRWPECLELMERAIKINPRDPLLFDDHARYALYLGQNAVAEGSLKKADDLDAYSHPWRTNAWENLRWIAKKYSTLHTDRFSVRLFSDDVAALSKIMIPFIERSYAMLTAKYQFTPTGVAADANRMLIEIFRSHSTFSVRTFGFDGLGALGVCFGPFIAMDAPNAHAPGEFSWARTFHHELTHTMTVGLSKGRIPRWFTEGLSTFEEAEFDPSWTRGMDRELFDAYHTDDILKLAEFDAAFSTPRIIFAYYQAGLECAWLVKTYGFEKVLEACRLFADDLPQEEVFRRAFGVATSVIDEGFKKFVAERIAPMKMQPRYRKDQREKMEEAWKAAPTDDLLVRLAWARMQNKQLADVEALLAEALKRKLADPRLKLLEARLAEKMSRSDRAKALLEELAKEGVQDYDLVLDLAKSAERRSDPEEAMTLYRDAISCFPTNAAPDSPRLALSRLLRGGGKVDEAIAMLEQHLKHAPEDLVSRRAIIDHRLATADWKAALAHLDRYVLIQPLEDRIHQMRAEILLANGSPADALLAADCAVETSKTAPAKASAHVTAAMALLKLDKKDEARARLEEALRIFPGHGAATKAMGDLASRPSGEK